MNQSVLWSFSTAYFKTITTLGSTTSLKIYNMLIQCLLLPFFAHVGLGNMKTINSSQNSYLLNSALAPKIVSWLQNAPCSWWSTTLVQNVEGKWCFTLSQQPSLYHSKQVPHKHNKNWNPPINYLNYINSKYLLYLLHSSAPNLSWIHHQIDINLKSWNLDN